MFSVTRSAPPLPPEVIDETMHSFSFSFTYSTGSSPPALRTVSNASGMCVPLQHSLSSVGEDLSTYLVKDRSWTLTFPAPPPLPMCVLPLWLRPQFHARMSISPAWFLSVDSPSTAPSADVIFKNISTDICASWVHVVFRDAGTIAIGPSGRLLLRAGHFFSDLSRDTNFSATVSPSS